MKNKEKPYIIFHILTSINGKITGSFFGRQETKAGGKFYQVMHITGSRQTVKIMRR